jgi:glutamate 5-kinase
VALLIEADMLLLLTDQKGLYTADPRTHPEAELISEVRSIDEKLRELAGDGAGALGVGGMATKLQAADIARRAGARSLHPARAGHHPARVNGEPVGTRFRRWRPRWRTASVDLRRHDPGGRLIVDAGQRAAA